MPTRPPKCEVWLQGVLEVEKGRIMNNPCDVKTLYDTEFEAEIAVSKASYDFGAEMVYYRCGRHWHIANKHRKNRSKNRRYRRTWCEACQSYLKSGNYRKHLTRIGHQRNVYKKEKETSK